MFSSVPQRCQKTCFLRHLTTIGVVAGLAVSCGRSSPSSPSPSTGSVVNLSANLSYCVDELTRYRASAGQPPLARSAELETFAAQAAQNDGLSHQPHHWFATTDGGGLSAAENEILWWQGYGVHSVIEQGLQQMWNGRPNGEHYDIMVGPYSQVAAGFSLTDPREPSPRTSGDRAASDRDARQKGWRPYFKSTRVPRIFWLLRALRKFGTRRSINSKYDDSAGVFVCELYSTSSR